MEINNMLVTLWGLPVGARIIVEYDHGDCVLDCEIDTMYDSDNGLDDDDPDYIEYYAVAVRVIHVIKNRTGWNHKPGTLFEISVLNEPTAIKDTDGKVLWARKDRL